MKNLTYVLLLLLFVNCSKGVFSHQSDFEKSYQAFQNFKNPYNGNDDYQTDWGSWMGYSGTTTISVRNNIVVQRDYKMSFPLDIANITDSMRAKNAWSETQSELNTHSDFGAFDPIILDSVYERAKNIWLKTDTNYDYYFEVDSLNLLRICGYIPKGCQDDCFTGIYINYIHSK